MSTFYAKLKLTGDSPESVLLTFSSVQKADQWWEIIQKTNWSGDLGLKKDNVKRSNPQWFTWPNGKGGAAAVLKAIESHDAMKPVKDDFDWTLFSEAKEPTIPVQDAQGNTTADTSAMEKKIAELEARLRATGTSTDVAKADTPAALVSATAGKNWIGGARFQGGPQHYAMASDAFKMALECKDRGDSRSFNMIFDQLFMEQRRTVGVRGKADPEGGYNSAKLISDIYAKAKELQEKGDDRPFGLIFGGVSMAYRRGTVLW